MTRESVRKFRRAEINDFDIILNEKGDGFSIFFQGEFFPIPIKFMRISERKKLSALIQTLVTKVEKSVCRR